MDLDVFDKYEGLNTFNAVVKNIYSKLSLGKSPIESESDAAIDTETPSDLEIQELLADDNIAGILIDSLEAENIASEDVLAIIESLLCSD